MSMARRMKTTSKLPIPEGAIKGAGLLFNHDIVSIIKRQNSRYIDSKFRSGTI